MSKKIVILHPAYWEQAIGGAELQIYHLITYLIKQGCEVHYIFEDKGSVLKNELEINLYPLKKVKINKRFGNRWFLYKKTLNRVLERIQPDAIYTRFYSSWSGIASEYAKANKCNHIWALASDKDVSRLREKIPYSKPLDLIEKKWVRKAYLQADVILTQNVFQQNKLSAYYSREGILIPQSASICTEDSIIKKDVPLEVLWIGNFKTLKQPQIFIDLAGRFANHNNIHFTMIGRSDKAYIDLLARAHSSLKNFKYLGELNNNEVNEHLLKSHILVNTSEYEGFSNTFVQAWMRKVVVLSLNSNPDELLTKKQIGFLCEDLDQMEITIKSLMEYPAQIKEIGEEAFKYACENHSLEKNIIPVLKSMGINE